MDIYKTTMNRIKIKNKINTVDYKINNQFIKLMLIFLSSSLFIYNALQNFQNDVFFKKVTAWCVLILSVYLAFISRKNWNFFIIFSSIAGFNYSICVAMYLDVFYGNLFTSFAYDPVAVVGINILLLFFIIVMTFMPKSIKVSERNNIFILKENYNLIFCIGIAVVLVLIWIFCFSRPSIQGVRADGDPLYEYSIIFFIIGYYYSGKNKFCNILLTFILCIFVLQVIYYGGRVGALQLAVMWFLINASHKATLRDILPWAIVIFVLFKGIAMFRATLQFSSETFLQVINALSEEKLTIDTAYAAYHASMTFLKVEDLIDMKQRLYMFGKFILYMILGLSKVPGASLPSYTRLYYVHYAGGVLPFYLHFYLGWFGVVLISAIVGLYMSLINTMRKESKGAIKCVSIWITCSTFRWYLYTPSALIRGVALILIAFYLSKIVHDIMKKICVTCFGKTQV